MDCWGGEGAAGRVISLSPYDNFDPERDGRKMRLLASSEPQKLCTPDDDNLEGMTLKGPTQRCGISFPPPRDSLKRSRGQLFVVRRRPTAHAPDGVARHVPDERPAGRPFDPRHHLWYAPGLLNCQALLSVSFEQREAGLGA